MEFDHQDGQHSPSSFTYKLKSSILCSSSCCNDEHEDESKVLESPVKDLESSSPKSTLSSWIKSECASLFSAKLGKNRHRGNTAEFRYDPLSYALNFEDDDSRIDEYPLRNFSARLPPSPKKNNNVVVSREIAAWS